MTSVKLRTFLELSTAFSIIWRSLGDSMGVSGFMSSLLQLLSYLTLSDLAADMQTIPSPSSLALLASTCIYSALVYNFHIFMDASHFTRFYSQ